MKNINKISDLWLHLEDSYISKGIAFKCSTRKQFLEKLSGLDAEGNDSIDKIKSFLAKESSTYTKEEQEQYSLLIALLDIVKLNLKKLPEIDYNLDDFVRDLLKESKIEEKTVDMDDFIKAITTPSENIIRLSLKDMYRNFKEFAPEIIRLVGNKIIKYTVLDNSLENIIAFQSPADIQKYILRLQGLPSIDDFHVGAIAYYNSTGTKRPMIFFNANEFEFEEESNKVKLFLDGKSYKVQEIKNITLSNGHTHTIYLSTVNTETDKLQAVYFV